MHPPKPSASIVSTIAVTRRSFSGWPCGNRLRWETLAETNNMAEAFLQAATHAPQPMQAAASIASSAASFGTGTALASGADPVGAVINPPACMMRSNAERSTTRSLIGGNALARNGSTVIVSPSWKLRKYVWQVATLYSGPCGSPLMTQEHIPQIPSRQS